MKIIKSEIAKALYYSSKKAKQTNNNAFYNLKNKICVNKSKMKKIHKEIGIEHIGYHECGGRWDSNYFGSRFVPFNFNFFELVDETGKKWSFHSPAYRVSGSYLGKLENLGENKEISKDFDEQEMEKIYKKINRKLLPLLQ